MRKKIVIVMFCMLISQISYGSRLFIVGVSPYLSGNTIKNSLKLVFGILSPAVSQQGDTIVFVNTESSYQIAKITLPDDERLSKKKYRAGFYKSKGVLLPIKRYYKSMTKLSESDRKKRGKVDIIEFLRTAKNISEAHSAESVEVVLSGSPIYNEKAEYSMTFGYPSDGHLFDRNSVYSSVDKGSALEGLNVHFFIHDKTYFLKGNVTEHKNKIERFWSLYISSQGGRMLSYTLDGGGFARIIKKLHEIRFSIDPEDKKKSQMHSISSGEHNLFSSNIAISTEAPEGYEGKLKIGINWDCNCDIDLYVLPKNGATELSYKRPGSDYGRHLKDYTQRAQDAYETVVLDEANKVVDIRQIKVFANFYGGGRAPNGVQGKVRISFKGRVYEGDYSIQAQRGNVGLPPRTSKEWTEINLINILKLK